MLVTIIFVAAGMMEEVFFLCYVLSITLKKKCNVLCFIVIFDSHLELIWYILLKGKQKVEDITVIKKKMWKRECL